MKRKEKFVQLAGNEKNTDLLPSASEHERVNLKDTSIKEPFNRKSDGSSANPSEIKISSKDASQHRNQFGIEKLKNLSLQNTRDGLLNVKGERKDEDGKENEISLPSVKDMKLYENWISEAAKKIPCVQESKNRIESATSLDSISVSESSKESEYIKLVLPFLLPKHEESPPFSFLDWVTHKLGGSGPTPTEDNDSRKESDPKVVSKDSSQFAKEKEGGKEEIPLSSADYKKLYEEWTLELKNAFPVPKPLTSTSFEEFKTEDNAQILAGDNSTPSEVTEPKNESGTKVKEPKDSKTVEKSEEIEKDWVFVEH